MYGQFLISFCGLNMDNCSAIRMKKIFFYYSLAYLSVLLCIMLIIPRKTTKLVDLGLITSFENFLILIFLMIYIMKGFNKQLAKIYSIILIAFVLMHCNL